MDMYIYKWWYLSVHSYVYIYIYVSIDNLYLWREEASRFHGDIPHGTFCFKTATKNDVKWTREWNSIYVYVHVLSGKSEKRDMAIAMDDDRTFVFVHVSGLGLFRFHQHGEI